MFRDWLDGPAGAIVGAAMKCTIVLALALWTGCASYDDAGTPAGTVKLFLRIMNRSATDSSALKEAYELLDRNARDALALRANKVATLAGRDFEPWQMLAQGRFRLRFAPAARNGIEAEVNGDQAVVTVTGDDGSQTARVPLVREQGRWRIRLEIAKMRGERAAVDQPDTPPDD